jgi:TPR repeat protein
MLKVRWLAVSLLAFATCTADLPGAVAREGPTVTELLSKAKTGDAIAEYNLGNMYSAGKGVSRDYAEAVKWSRKAAEQGVAMAEFNLGLMYDDGRGVPQDYVQAHLWLYLAAAAGEIAPQIADTLTEKMTPDEIAEAQRLAREWRPVPAGQKN